MESIMIIGAGIAGLSAGCYARMNGYRTQIFELHDKPGGLCTSWERKGYTFDGCIHWLVGSKAGSGGMNDVWQELGALQGRQIVNHSEFVRIEGSGDKALILYTNVEQLERHMNELAPGDSKPIAEMCRAIRLFTRLGEVMGGLGGAFGLLGRLKAAVQRLFVMPVLSKYRKMSLEKFAARFNDPFLRQAFTTAFFDMHDSPVIGLFFTLASMHNQDAGYPMGGSLAFARAIERRYLDLGGEIHYKSRVSRILVESGSAPCADRAVGVRLADGSEHRADVVISAADGHATIFDMLNGKYVSDQVRGYYQHLPIFPPIVQVSLGIARDLSDQPHSANYPLDQPLSVAGVDRKRLGFRHYCYDPTLAPAGKSIVECMFPSNHSYWKELSEDPERYDAEKKDIAIKVIDQLEKRFPGIADQVEAVDVATPLTYERYTGNWQGSMEGWLPTTETADLMMGKGMDKTLPGLDNFYMIGQWVEPGGGLPPAATSARGVVERICKQAGKPFVTSTP